MPATAFDPTLAAGIHVAGVSYDTSLFGIPADMTGLNLRSVTPKPTRAIENVTGRFRENIMFMGVTPGYQLDVDAQDLLESSAFTNKHPLQPVTRATVANYVSTARHGFPDSGYFFMREMTPNMPAGNLRENKFTLELVFTPTASVQVIAAP